MSSILDQIAHSCVTCKKSNRLTEANYIYLRGKLDKDGRSHLLALVDEKDLLIECESVRHFKQGFRLGLRLAVEAMSPAAAGREN